MGTWGDMDKLLDDYLGWVFGMGLFTQDIREIMIHSLLVNVM